MFLCLLRHHIIVERFFLPARTVLFADAALRACRSQLLFARRAKPHPSTDRLLEEIMGFIDLALYRLTEVHLDG